MKDISFKSILIALVIDILFSVIFITLNMIPVVVYITSSYGMADVELFSASSHALLMGIPFAFVGSVLGGYIVSKREPEKAFLHALILGALITVWGGGNILITPSAPQWFLIVNIVFNIPATLIGYVVARKF